MQKETIFVRKATGLVRVWSLLDAFAFNAGVHPMALSAYAFSLAVFWPEASLVPAIILGLIFTSVQCVVYSMLVSTMPRAGGEYLWISRILNPAIGYVVVLVGWVFAMIHWFPIYTLLIGYQFFAPLSAVFGNLDLAYWWLTPSGLFLTFLLLVVIGLVLIVAGMKWSGRAISIAYLATVVGSILFFILFLLFSQSDFKNAYNAFYASNFNMTSAYQQVLDKATQSGLPSSSLSVNWSYSLFALVPLLAFANSWSMWGAPLYGEVRGGSELRRGVVSMLGSNISNTLMALAFLLLTVRVAGYQFFQSANLLWWYRDPIVPFFPFSPFWVLHLTGNAAITSLVLVLCISYLLIACPLEIFLPTTRILFAMAFDRTMPSPLAELRTRGKIPLISFIAVTGIGAILMGLYCYVPEFRVFFMDATVAPIISFFFTAIAAIILPLKLPKVFGSSPASKYRVGKIPLISVFGAVTACYFLFLIVRWAQDPLYGVNNLYSGIYFAIVYGCATLLYFFYRWYRKKQGIDLSLVFKEIPTD